MNVGILHPGEMGVTVAAAVRNGGHAVRWTSERRSAATRARAEAAGLEDAGFLTALCEQSEAIVCVCPPAEAATIAKSVAARKFAGLYIEANAISPPRTKRIGEMIERGGGRFVDAGIIGPPAIKAGTTSIYFSGPAAAQAAALFVRGPLRTEMLGDAIGRASALKMCYAAFSKGSAALLASVVAAADELDVREALMAQWQATNPDMGSRVNALATDAGKAWRFVAEMEEIAATLRDADQPGEFHDAATEIFRRLSVFRGNPPSDFNALLTALRHGSPDEHQ
jgi:3-hydroxyisobutyrate dehydrogenase-like beta-hydroxyacid dehydrogenase